MPDPRRFRDGSRLGGVLLLGEFLDRRLDGVMRFEGLKGRVRALPGMSALVGAATGWIKAPNPSRPDPRRVGDTIPASDRGDA